MKLPKVILSALLNLLNEKNLKQSIMHSCLRFCLVIASTNAILIILLIFARSLYLTDSFDSVEVSELAC